MGNGWRDKGNRDSGWRINFFAKGASERGLNGVEIISSLA